MMEEKEARARLETTRKALQRFADCGPEKLCRAASMVVDALKSGGKVLVFGNGGSAAQAQHIAGELVNRMLMDRDPMAAIALTADTAAITSIANDYGYERVFEKQVRALGRPGDLAWAISTSGASRNVNLALEAAKEMGMSRLAMAGREGSDMGDLADLCLWVEAESTPIIQEVHLAAAHVICELVERELWGDKA